MNTSKHQRPRRDFHPSLSALETRETTSTYAGTAAVLVAPAHNASTTTIHPSEVEPPGGSPTAPVVHYPPGGGYGFILN